LVQLSGYGLFAIERIPKDEYIISYLGEVFIIYIYLQFFDFFQKLMTVEEGSNREKMSEIDQGIYLFSCTDKVRN